MTTKNSCEEGAGDMTAIKHEDESCLTDCRGQCQGMGSCEAAVNFRKSSGISMPAIKKTCAGCRWLLNPEETDYFYICEHEKRKQCSCMDERSEHGQCGPSGILWEPRKDEK